jgi:SsrA-binding protein
MKVLASNRKAYFDFDILENIVAGISLDGWEVKAIKASKISLNGAYIKVVNQELFLEGVSVTPLKFSPAESKSQETRKRKLLLTKRQITLLTASAKIAGNTLVPLEVVENEKGLIKINVALVKGRKKFDKRQKLKEKDIKKQINFERKKYNI